MKKVTKELREKVKKAGQEHLFKFLDDGKLSKSEESQLASQLEGFEYEKVASYLESSLAAEKALKKQKITPPEDDVVVSVEEAEKSTKKWSDLGFELVSKGKVAFVVLSGGQGTRLGFAGPKGCYNVGLPSKKTLFQMQAERLVKLQNLVAKEHADVDTEKATIPYYIMTSPLNHDQTTKYFKENEYFGLKENNVFFFKQGTLPCLTPEGKFILETKAKVATAPDGNGGIYAALASSGALKDMERRGIKWIMACSVDNALIQVADPAFIGLCEERKCELGNKSCEKNAWNESVGVLGKKDDKYNVVEYSEITDEMAQSKGTDGKLQFRSGNICIHTFTLDFINKIFGQLGKSYHIARKKIPAANEKGEAVKPTENNGLKLEMFIFDVFPMAERFVNLECKRSENFAPVKNAPGKPKDSPDTARKLLFARGKKWLENAGAVIKGESEEGVCEVTPAASLQGEGLEKFEGATLTMPLVVMAKSDTKDIAVKGLKPQKTGDIEFFENKEGLHIYLVD